MSGFATLQGRNYAIKRAESKRWSYENSGGWARAGGVLAPPSVRRSVATGTVGAAGLLDFPHVAGVGAVGGVLLRMAGVLVRLSKRERSISEEQRVSGLRRARNDAALLNLFPLIAAALSQQVQLLN